LNKVNTMEEFAALAGVSRPTASKYFENPESIGLRSKNKIEQALKVFDYRPNLLASRLMKKETRTIGVLIPSLSDPFYASIIKSIENAAIHYGYSVLIECAHGQAHLEDKAIDNFLAIKVDGICYAPSGMKKIEGKLKQLQKEYPLIFIDAVFAGVRYSIKNNNTQSIEILTDYMISKGHKPAYFPMPNVNSSSDERYDAYIALMKKNRLTAQLIPVEKSTTWSFEAWAHDETVKLIKSNSFNFESVICANDRIAFGMISALYNYGCLDKSGPNYRDIAIAGHDNHPLSQFTCPPLTTAEQDVQSMGLFAVQKILSILGIKKFKLKNHIKLDAKLIIRDSA